MSTDCCIIPEASLPDYGKTIVLPAQKTLNISILDFMARLSRFTIPILRTVCFSSTATCQISGYTCQCAFRYITRFAASTSCDILPAHHQQ